MCTLSLSHVAAAVPRGAGQCRFCASCRLGDVCLGSRQSRCLPQPRCSLCSSLLWAGGWWDPPPPNPSLRVTVLYRLPVPSSQRGDPAQAHSQAHPGLPGGELARSSFTLRGNLQVLLRRTGPRGVSRARRQHFPVSESPRPTPVPGPGSGRTRLPWGWL